MYEGDIVQATALHFLVLTLQRMDQEDIRHEAELKMLDEAPRDHSANEFDPGTAVAYMAGIRGAIELLVKIQLGDHVRDRPNLRRPRHRRTWPRVGRSRI